MTNKVLAHRISEVSGRRAYLVERSGGVWPVVAGVLLALVWAAVFASEVRP